MEVRENEKGKGIYATKDYQPWEIIHSENSLMTICTSHFPNKVLGNADIDKKFDKFVTSHREDIRKYHEAKYGVILGKLKDQQILSLAETKVSIPRNVLRNAEKASGISREKIEKLTRIYRANNFSINGLFGNDIGTAMFYTASFFNHSCDPNAFALVTYNKIIVYARRSIQVGEEITIPYSSIGVHSKDKLTFKCLCGNCDKVQRIPEEIMKQFEDISNFEDSIDFIFDKIKEEKDDNILNAYMKLLLESYYEIWATGRDHRLDDLYKIIIEMDLSPYIVIMEAYLVALTIAYRKGLKEDFEKLKPYVRIFLRDTVLIEHIIICIRLAPHHYHQDLLSALMAM